MKNILSAIITLIGYAVIISSGFAQDTTPRGPAQWTATNWLGFCIQIGLFALAIFGIYKLALGGGGDRNDEIIMISRRPSGYGGQGNDE